MPRTYSSTEKIRAELAWITETPDPHSNERPRQFTLDEEICEIAAVLNQWYQPYATFFKVQTVERKTYLLRYDEETDEWTLQSGFDRE